MITKFKIFEDMFDVAFRTGSENKPNFEIGDTVVCINDRKIGTNKNHKYLVTNIFYDDDRSWYCHLKYENGVTLANVIGQPYWYFCNDFISETEYDSKKYNL